MNSRNVWLAGLSVLCFMTAWFFLRVSEKPFTYKVLTPDAAVMAVLSDPLKFVGATDEDGDILNDAFYGGPACVWRNRYALVISHNCTKKSIDFHTEIFTPKGEIFVFYAEGPPGSLDYDDIADIQSSRYEGFGAGLYQLLPEDRQPFRLDMTMDELREFYPADVYGPFYDDEDAHDGYWQYEASELCQVCLAGTQCYRDGEKIAGIWKPAASRFIKKPPKEWYLFLKLMRNLAKKHGLNRA